MREWERGAQDGKKIAAGDQTRAMQHLPWIASAGPRDLTFEVGFDAWGLNPLGDPRGSLALDGEPAAPR
jgi:hypothetical protein